MRDKFQLTRFRHVDTTHVVIIYFLVTISLPPSPQLRLQHPGWRAVPPGSDPTSAFVYVLEHRCTQRATKAGRLREGDNQVTKGLLENVSVDMVDCARVKGVC